MKSLYHEISGIKQEISALKNLNNNFEYKRFFNEGTRFQNTGDNMDTGHTSLVGRQINQQLCRVMGKVVLLSYCQHAEKSDISSVRVLKLLRVCR